MTMHVLMLVWTSVATDARVLREAVALVELGHTVHIIGRAIPAGFVPPPGIEVDSVGAPPLAQGRTRTLRAPERLVRWALLPTHVQRRLRGWQSQALEVAAAHRAQRPVDVVHAHDFTALPVGAELARRWGVPLVYDSHEYWVGRPVEGRPAPLLHRREAALEDRLGAAADAVVTVGQGVADALRADHPGWPQIHVVRNTFPAAEVTSARPGESSGDRPSAVVYAGRLARDRELEVIAAASRQVDLPVQLVGPSDAQWLSGFDPGRATVLPAESLDAVDRRLVGAGLALVTHSDRWVNHRLALPNKLFHAVALGVPIVATDVGELAATVRAHGVGALYRPGDADDLARAVREVVERYPAYRAAVRAAQAHLCWDRDKDTLGLLYSELARRRAGRAE